VTLNTNKVLPRKQAYEYLIGKYTPSNQVNFKSKQKTKKPKLSLAERRIKFNSRAKK